ncbi:efflux RND transporter permease subunit [Eubacterium sp. F2]|jgi:predicted RND superfamily exporter protein|uniref:efflux RND transporter permease subunit n=1 Tax=Eubacterium sp. F2 TaxID=3381348 RepID=UPI00390840F1
MGGFGEKIVKSRYVILVVAVLLLIPSVLGIKATRINYDMLTYLPKNLETMKGQDLLLHDFGKGGFSMVVTENMKSKQVADLKNKISKVNHVDSVVNLDEVINPNVPLAMYPESVRKNIQNPDASMLVVFYDTSTSAEPTLKAVTQIRHLCTKDAYVSGMSALVQDLKNLCEQEEAKYVLIAVLLSLAAMMLLLDSFAAPFLFILSIGMAIIYNLGSNVMFGEISYITKAIAAVLQLGTTMDYSIFLWHSYMENLDKGHERKEAMASAVNETLISVTGSSVTTIAGFLALCFMTYTMGRDLGLVMAKGVLLGVITSVTILPSLLLLFSRLLERTRHKSLIPDAGKLAHGLTSRYGIYIAIFAIALAPAIYGYTQDNVIYDFSKMFTGSGGKSLSESQAPVIKANQKLQEDFNIGTTHMIIAKSSLPSKDGKGMTEAIEKVDGVNNVIGYDAFLGEAVPRQILPDGLETALSAKRHQLILVNSAYKVSTTKCNNQIDRINTIIRKYDPTAKLIGEGPATKDLIQITNRDFKIVNIISILAVFFIIFFVLRSVSLPFILVAVIEFAIYMNLGISGFTHLELPFIVPVCISTIQLGSTVDYAILLSTRYKTERMAGNSKRQAIETATTFAIPSIITSALGFFTATFGVGVYSNIGIISTLCDLMARGAIISMISVILVLPSLLMALDKVVCATTIGLRKKDFLKRQNADTNIEA